jgi:hypothetical protein
MRHEAIYNLYPNVVAIDDSAGAFDANGIPVPVNEADVAEEIARLIPIKQSTETEAKRQAAYIAESDPLFFKWQRGEATEQAWKDKVAEIKARYPKVQA